ncbi:hypothetical protein C8Q70DRAFT_1053930 [Cubamyces menziesii]|nr:hypothetical protein C8Q70DRAFT_1053930 [Cubamyces menziesii]
MGQFWAMKNIDRQEVYDSGKLGEWLLASDHSYLLGRLMAPIQLPKEYDTWLTEGKRVTQRSALFKLPNEMFDMIFDELESDDVSLLCLAITCKDLLALAKQPIVDAVNRGMSTWANCRLICMGEYTQYVEELPEGMLTADELARIKAALAAASSEDENEEERPYVDDLLQLVGTPREPLLTDKIRDFTMEHRFRRARSSSASAKGQHWRDMGALEDLVSHCTHPEPEVLCNVSKGEYVRRAALPAVPGFEMVSLAHALIVQVCWSPDPSCAFAIPAEYEERISRGRWAGDRFCVTSAETMPKLAPELGGWRDVSDDVARFLEVFLYE